MNYLKFSRLLQIADDLDKKSFFVGANIIDQLLVLAASDKKKLELLFGTGNVYYRKNEKGLWQQLSPTRLFDYILAVSDLNSIWNDSNTKRSDNASDYVAGQRLKNTMISPPHNVRIIPQADVQAIIDLNEENIELRKKLQGEMHEERLRTTPEGAWAVGALQEFGQLVEVRPGYVRKGLEIDSPNYLRCRNCKSVFHKDDAKEGEGKELYCPECGEGNLYKAPYKSGARIRIRNFPNVSDVVEVLDHLFGVTSKVVGNIVIVDSVRALDALKRLGFKVGLAENEDYTAEEVWVTNRDNSVIEKHFEGTPLESEYRAGRLGESPSFVYETVTSNDQKNLLGSEII